MKVDNWTSDFVQESCTQNQHPSGKHNQVRFELLNLVGLPPFDGANDWPNNLTSRLFEMVKDPPLLSFESITPELLNQLELLNQEMDQQYNQRARVISTRLKATLGALEWTDGHQFAKLKEEADALGISRISMYDLFGARSGLLLEEQDQDTRLQSENFVKRRVMGPVADRGGRPEVVLSPAEPGSKSLPGPYLCPSPPEDFDLD